MRNIYLGTRANTPLPLNQAITLMRLIIAFHSAEARSQADVDRAWLLDLKRCDMALSELGQDSQTRKLL